MVLALDQLDEEAAADAHDLAPFAQTLVWGAGNVGDLDFFAGSLDEAASNRDTAEWLAMFDDVLLAQSAVDRFKNAAYDFVMEGESYRPRLKPKLDAEGPPPPSPAQKPRARPRRRR